MLVIEPAQPAQRPLVGRDDIDFLGIDRLAAIVLERRGREEFGQIDVVVTDRILVAADGLEDDAVAGGEAGVQGDPRTLVRAVVVGERGDVERVRRIGDGGRADDDGSRVA
jgi:hypothetical protein